MTRSISRRDFLKLGATATAIGMVAPKVFAAEGEKKPALEFRDLGRTGLKVTTVGLGCMVAPEAVVAKAFDMGINWFDTANGYKVDGEPSELAVGRVFKDRRDKAFICTKIGFAGQKPMMQSLETSLTRLGTDHVELLLSHGADCKSPGGTDAKGRPKNKAVFNEDAMAVLEQAKKQGKARFIGTSTHSGMVEVIDAVVEAKIYDAVLTVYNFGSPKDLRDAVANAKKAGIAVIAMKTQRGGFKDPAAGMTPHQAALKWVLDDANICCAVPGTRDFAQLDQNFGVMGTRLGYLERRKLERFAQATAGLYCTGCGRCAGTCAKGVSIPDVRRCAMYLDGYRDEALARTNYREVLADAAACAGCEICTARCVNGVALQPILAGAHSRLA